MKRPFIDTLRGLRKGVAHDELTNRLNEVVEAVTRTGKEGSLTLKIKVKPLPGGAMLNVEDDITASIPKMTTGGTVMFPTPEHNLSLRDPRQPDLPNIAVVDPGTGEIKQEAAHG